MSDLPTIRIQGDQQLGRQYIPAARAKLDRLREMLSHRDVAVGGDHGALADNVYCYVKIAGGVSVIQIVAESSTQQTQELAELIEIKYPDFLSGTVLNGTIENDLLYSFKPTSNCVALHGYASELQPMKRLGVRPYPVFSQDIGNQTPPPELSQYSKLKPGWYSGAMRKLVQFLMGYGKIPEETIYKPRKEPPEPDYFVPPETKYQKDVRNSGVQIRYDWRYIRTHGLTKASDGKWWLVEISQSKGIHAMPLRLYPATATDEFREYLESVGDVDALEVVDLFGGFPTGENIPQTGELLDCYVRAGLVVRLSDASELSEFYSHNSYSSACGWAFSESGRKAANTGYRFGEDTVQRGVLYEITMNIGKTEETEPVGAAIRLKQFLMKREEDLGDKLHPLLLKCDRLTDDQIADFLGMTLEDLAQALDDLVLDPVAQGSAHVAKVSEGKIWWLGSQSPAFKVYEPLLGCLVSHDFRPNRPGPPEGTDVRCNTTLYAYYHGELMREVRYYWIDSENESTYEVSGEQECQYAGQWGYRQTSGSNMVWPRFYTTEIDTREVFPETLSEEQNTGVDIGYTSVQFSDIPANPWFCYLFRTKSFRITTVKNSYSSKTKEACVAVPANDREAYYYFEQTSIRGARHSMAVTFKSLGDPIKYSGGRLFINMDGTPDGCGERSTFRRVDKQFRDDGPCSELADEGPWASRCQQIEPMTYTVPLVVPPAVLRSEPDTSTISGKLVISGEDGPIDTYDREITGDDAVYAGGYLFVMTPSEGFTQQISMNRNCLGDRHAIMYAPTINEGMALGEGIEPELMGKNITFIGVHP